ncbi:hypothetical protein C8R44DRAFT_725663 [Mycena epipterygia]|nr:hypothetical protein C8R44DRAFT_725663 [Mycena epipterygia]
MCIYGRLLGVSDKQNRADIRRSDPPVAAEIQGENGTSINGIGFETARVIAKHANLSSLATTRRAILPSTLLGVWGRGSARQELRTYEFWRCGIGDIRAGAVPSKPGDCHPGIAAVSTALLRQMEHVAGFTFFSYRHVDLDAAKRTILFRGRRIPHMSVDDPFDRWRRKIADFEFANTAMTKIDWWLGTANRSS